jgi:NAD-dependent DNA ligase
MPGVRLFLVDMAGNNMASEKAAKILRKKEAPFTEDQIIAMSEREAWAWIFAHDQKIREAKAQAKLLQICLTGFTDSKKEELRAIAQQGGFEVKDSVTKNLVLLVTGENAGPSKITKAEAQGCVVTDEAGFMEYVRSKKED